MEENNKHNQQKLPEVRSSEVNEILGQIPPFVLRWGSTVFVGVIFVLLLFSWIFKYPEKIEANVVISQENPPADIVAKVDGRIDTIFVSDNQEVKRGEVLAMLENPANPDDIIILEEIIDHIEGCLRNDTGAISEKLPGFTLILGSIQSTYEGFSLDLNNYLSYRRLNPDLRRLSFLQKQLSDYNNYLATLDQQILTLNQDIQLGSKRLNRDSILHVGGALSNQEYEASLQQYNKLVYSFENQQTVLANTKIEITRLRQQIMEAELNASREMYNLEGRLYTAVENVRNAISEWKQSYMLISPIDGTVTFTSYWSRNQVVATGVNVFTIMPGGEHRIIGKAYIGVQGAGKLQKGQEVIIRLTNFPYMEYGVIKGKLINVSLVTIETPDGPFYTAKIDLPDKLLTTYNKKIPFKQELYGEAEIITKDKRLIERIIEPVIALLKNRT